MKALPPFQSLLDRHRGDVLGFLIASVGPQEAEDCFQDTFLAALRAYPRLRDASNLRGWLLTIASRKAVDSHRRRGRSPEARADVPDRLQPPPPERETAMWEAVRSLPPKQRSAVAHRFLLDLSHAEIGQVLGCSEDAARRNVHEGLKKLREAGWTR